MLFRSRGLGRLDSTLGLVRVEADLYAATGRDELALAIWTLPANAQSITQYHYGRYLEAHGDLAGAARAYAFAGDAGPYSRAWDGFRRVAPRWWNELPAEERWRTLREALNEPFQTPGRHSLVFSLRNYAVYVLSSPQEGRARVMVTPGSLEAVAIGLRATDVTGLPHQFLDYPCWLKDLHAVALLSPWPVGSSLAVAGLDAAGRRLRLPGW